ncbi:MAG: DUF3137 domain-containing protein [Cyclobacteriaceae bacterium]|jgi:hypothetical protein
MSALSQELDQFEQERLNIIQKAKKPRLFGLVFCLSAIPLFYFFENPIWGILTIIVGIIIFSVGEYPKKVFAKKFKEEVISKLVKHLHADLHYDPSGGFHYSFLYDQGLINTSPNRGKSEDRIHGMVGATAIDLCEQLVEKKTTTTDSKGRTKTHIQQLFKGLVLSADFHKSFNGETVILPDWAENSSWSWLAKKFQSSSRDGNRIVQLENPEFEKLFAVYSSDQVEARYLLSTSMMDRMVKLYQKLSASSTCKIMIRFHNEKMIMAIDWSNNFFEYEFKKTVKEEVEETYTELELCTGIVEDLNLNTRIWSK